VFHAGVLRATLKQARLVLDPHGRCGTPDRRKEMIPEVLDGSFDPQLNRTKMKIITAVRWVGCGLALWLLAWRGAATDYSTTNRESLGHFWKVAEEKARPVTVLSFGDSMADSYRSPTFYLMLQLEGRLGTSGYAFNNYRNKDYIVLTNGASIVPLSSLWYTFHVAVPPGGGVWWQNEIAAGGVKCDEAGIFYVRQPQGGLFTLSVSTNAGPWGTQLTLDGYSLTPVGVFTNLTLALDIHRIRVDGISGTNYILGPRVLMAHTNGVLVAFTEEGGIGLSTVTNVPLSIRGPVFAALKPDLIVWHMKEEIPPLASWLDESETWWTNAFPDCDVLYIGTPWTIYDNTDTRTMDQNQIVRDFAVSHARAYVDLMQPGINYDWLSANGLISADGVHPTYAGGQWGANIIWDDMNFFALALPRQLSLSLAGELVQVTFPTAPGATYTVQSSANLHDWSPEMTIAGSGSLVSTNLPRTDPRHFYRLRLTPN
jgi:hypothetical protein